MPTRNSLATYSRQYAEHRRKPGAAGPITDLTSRWSADSDARVNVGAGDERRQRVERGRSMGRREVSAAQQGVIRERMGQSQRTRAEGAATPSSPTRLIVDHSGIYKADVGSETGASMPIGKAGKPDRTPARHRHRAGPRRSAGEGAILTDRRVRTATSTSSARSRSRMRCIRALTTMPRGGTGCPGAWDRSPPPATPGP